MDECSPREPLSAQKVRQVLAAEESRGGEGVVQPFIICNLQVLLSPSSPTLPSTFLAELQKSPTPPPTFTFAINFAPGEMFCCSKGTGL